MLHPKEIIIRDLSKEAREALFAEAERLGKAYVEALKEQERRQV